jgi:hypothetical protein
VIEHIGAVPVEETRIERGTEENERSGQSEKGHDSDDKTQDWDS